MHVLLKICSFVFCYFGVLHKLIVQHCSMFFISKVQVKLIIFKSFAKSYSGVFMLALIVTNSYKGQTSPSLWRKPISHVSLVLGGNTHPCIFHSQLQEQETLCFTFAPMKYSLARHWSYFKWAEEWLHPRQVDNQGFRWPRSVLNTSGFVKTKTWNINCNGVVLWVWQVNTSGIYYWFCLH